MTILCCLLTSSASVVKRVMAIVEEVVEKDDVAEKVEQLKKQGNTFFTSGEMEKAISTYTEGLEICPDGNVTKSLLYSNLAAAHNRLEQWEEAAKFATSAIEAGVPNQKALDRRAFAYSNISEKYEDSIKDYETLLETPGTSSENRKRYEGMVAELRAKVEDRNQRLKEDMVEKVKDLGNLLLRPFGLSTDSFQLTPNGQGGYSVNMKNTSEGKTSK